MIFERSRRGESEVIVVIGMVLMLVLGVAIDRLFLLQVLPTARVQELLHLGVTQTPVSTPASAPMQGQHSTSTTSSSSARSGPQYLGSSGARIASSLEMTSGPTCSGSYIRGVVRNKSSKSIFASVWNSLYTMRVVTNSTQPRPCSATLGRARHGGTKH